VKLWQKAVRRALSYRVGSVGWTASHNSTPVFSRTAIVLRILNDRRYIDNTNKFGVKFLTVIRRTLLLKHRHDSRRSKTVISFFTSNRHLSMIAVTV
jgi:hypothetical protein